MSKLVIVALPSADDYVWNISSEKKPHMTILFLGPVTEGVPVLRITEFVQHATRILEMGPFMLDVDRREELGEDKADVLFFRKDWTLNRIAEFRGQLLQNNDIRTAYDSVEQFPEWQPHLTLGYPVSPAREDKRDYPGIHWVNFDRVAVWFGESEGPEFRLTYKDDLAEVAMSTRSEAGAAFIEHYGVKGMRWGVRRESGPVSPTAASVVKGNKFTKTKIKAKGGENHPATEDALKVAAAQQKRKRSGNHALSNKELQEIVTRLNLEQQLHQLEGRRPKSAGKQFTENLLKDPVKTVETGKGVVDTGVNVARFIRRR